MLTVVGRGRLPYAALHGEPLVRHAVRALQALSARHERVAAPVVIAEPSEVEAVAGALAGLDVTVEGAGAVYEQPGDLLLHDPLCPLVGPDLLAEVLGAGVAAGRAVAAYRPVTDTLKTVEAGLIEGTVDRDTLAALVSPVFVPAARPGPAPLGGFGEVVAWLRSWGPVDLVRAPAMARRVDDESAVNLLECVDELGRRLRTS